MIEATTVQTASPEPPHVTSGPALLAIALSELARGIRGLRRSASERGPRTASPRLTLIPQGARAPSSAFPSGVRAHFTCEVQP